MSGRGSRKALRGRQIIMRIREGLSCGAARLVSCYWVSLFIRGRSAYADPVRQPRVRRRVHIRRVETTFSIVSTSACSTTLSQSRASDGEPTSFARVRASVMGAIIRRPGARPVLRGSYPTHLRARVLKPAAKIFWPSHEFAAPPSHDLAGFTASSSGLTQGSFFQPANPIAEEKRSSDKARG